MFRRIRSAWKILTSRHYVVFTMGGSSEDNYRDIHTDDRLMLETIAMELDEESSRDSYG